MNELNSKIENRTKLVNASKSTIVVGTIDDIINANDSIEASEESSTSEEEITQKKTIKKVKHEKKISEESFDEEKDTEEDDYYKHKVKKRKSNEKEDVIEFGSEEQFHRILPLHTLPKFSQVRGTKKRARSRCKLCHEKTSYYCAKCTVNEHDIFTICSPLKVPSCNCFYEHVTPHHMITSTSSSSSSPLLLPPPIEENIEISKDYTSINNNNNYHGPSLKKISKKSQQKNDLSSSSTILNYKKDLDDRSNYLSSLALEESANKHSNEKSSSLPSSLPNTEFILNDPRISQILENPVVFVGSSSSPSLE